MKNKPLNNGSQPISEQAFMDKLEELNNRTVHLYEMVPKLEQCARLTDYLQDVFEIREGLNQLEQGLLQRHLRCCISSNIKIPGEVVMAVSRLSARRHGAIIAIEQEDHLDDCLRAGMIIDAVVSTPLLESIFYPGSELHDGAVFIRNKRIIKAGCLLPFAPTGSGVEALRLGTRHQAAVGLSQVSDALIIVVSEEKGWISLAHQGRLYPNIGTSALLKKLEHPESRI